MELRLGEDAAHSPTWIRQEDGTQVLQAAAQQPRKLWQEACHLNESTCDRWLGPRACINLRAARNTLALTGMVSALLAGAAVAAATAVMLARHTRQLWQFRHGWSSVPAQVKPDMLV